MSLGNVLLSASFPEDGRSDESGPHSPQDIGMAASAVVDQVLIANGHLVFGGHPSISPLVLNRAAEVGRYGLVTVFQAEFFRDQVTSEVVRLTDRDGFGRAVWVAEGKADVEANLTAMRREMLRQEFSAAFFIGGMDGIEAEFTEFGVKHPDTPRFLLVQPGGRAALIAERRRPRMTDNTAAIVDVAESTWALYGRGYDRLVTLALGRVTDNV